jgi:enediyne biosynthesis protein E7
MPGWPVAEPPTIASLYLMSTNRFTLRLLRDFAANPLVALRKASADAEPLMRLQVGGVRRFVATDALTARTILTGPNERYERTADLPYWFPPAGEGVASSPHKKWLRQRRMLAPFFKAQSDERLREIVEQEVQALCGRLAPSSDTLEPVDVHTEVITSALLVAARHLLLDPFRGDARHLVNAIQRAMHYSSAGRAAASIAVKPICTDLAWRVLHPAPKRRAMRIVEDEVDEIIRIVRADRSLAAPLLAEVLVAEERGELDPGEVRDHVSTFFVAAVDSVGSSILWTLWHLAQHSETQDRVASEGPEGALSGAVIHESMRLVPPLSFFQREVREAHELGGQRLRVGDQVVICPYVLHTSTEYWEEPDVFDPGRFLVDGTLKTSPGFHYLPFGQGGHACLGRRMATLETEAFVRGVCSRFSFSLAGKTERTGNYPLDVKVAVLVKGGLWLSIQKRA